uniref:receptor protein-tyrosine kinase n=1 Tax=Steinernema glaseri TaxID=37863 RepID=A0A1I7Z7X8_9BILA
MNAHRTKVFAPRTLPLLFLLFSILAKEVPEKRCGSVHIRTQKSTFFRSFTQEDDFTCTVIEGDLSITIFRETETSRYVFPYLREVTGYLLIYNYVGLTSLKDTFPALRVIGGENLVMNYAVVIYRNPDLEDVALEKLTLIKNGGVWITENPKLCNTRYIDWKLFTSLPTAPIRSDEDQILRCEHVRSADLSVGPGCDPEGNRCHDLCVGGCTRANDVSACHSCKKVLQNNVCMEKCPDGQFELLNRRCITAEECHGMAPIRANDAILYWKTLGDRCHFECPFGYAQSEEEPNQCTRCNGVCVRVCDADYTINTLSDARDMRECDVVSGNLVIDLGINMLTPELLHQAFGRIREVKGYLIIRFSHAFTSFDAFKNLRRIGGKNLYRNRYALAVFENYNLRKAFSTFMEIKVGSVMFHNNRVLCYKEIVKFLEKVKMTEEVTEFDVSSVSNGEKALCVKPNLKVQVDNRFSNGFTIQFPNFNETDRDHRDFLGHQIFYKAVKNRKIRLFYEEEEACDSTWNMEFVPPMPEEEDRTAFVGLSGLIFPNTLYAFYVKTRMTKGHHQDVSISAIMYVKTQFAEPSIPVGLRVVSTKPTEIKITWNPPLAPNGVITHYIVKWRIENPVEEKIEDHCDITEVSQSKYAFSAGLEDPSELNRNANLNTTATCPAIPGCCDCNNKNKTGKLEISSEWPFESESSKMENQVQNLVFVGDRKKRNIIGVMIDLHDAKLREEGNATKEYDENKNMTESFSVDSLASEGLINVSGTQLTIKNLFHFTNYRITLDIINASTIEHIDAEQQNRSRLVWELPNTPNGDILAFRLRFTLSNKAPIEYCINLTDFTENKGALTKSFALEGDVYMEIRTVTTYGISGPSRPIVVHFPKDRFLLILFSVILACLFIIAVGGIVLYKTRRRTSPYDGSYPEFYPYEVYKPDDWELNMDDLEPDKKIGQGSFGEVYLFRTKGVVRSRNGYEFTKCAGKVLKASDNKYERDKFLSEGSMMKKFDTAFVVKLYGIVSTCNPPMVVMEYMDNVRVLTVIIDFLI